ncbi:MAG: hypothetical protein ACRELV_02100 [Longimicrobiales bacterium]
MKWQCLLTLMIGIAALAPTDSLQAATNTTPSATDITAKEKEIADLTRQIEELKKKKSEVAAEGDVIEAAVAQVTRKLQQAELELKKTQATISKVQQEQTTTTDRIAELEQEIRQKKTHLQAIVRELYEREQESIVRIFFSSWSLSEVLAQHAAYEHMQQQAVTLIKEMRTNQEELWQKQQALEQQENDLAQLEQMLGDQQEDISEHQKTQQAALVVKEQEEQQYVTKIKEVEDARQEIEQNIFTLKNVQVEVSFNNAYDMARYAGKLTGVRSALLLAVLKVESNVGDNIGSGTFPDDMQPQSRDAFLRITAKLGIDPKTAKISRRPSNGRGWGGAIGPAQIMPATWETIEPRLMQLTGKQVVNPYDLADAFVATAVFLADRGATSPTNEVEAVGRYIAGPNWHYYTWYIDKVMAVAEEYAKEGF